MSRVTWLAAVLVLVLAAGCTSVQDLVAAIGSPGSVDLRPSVERAFAELKPRLDRMREPVTLRIAAESSLTSEADLTAELSSLVRGLDAGIELASSDASQFDVTLACSFAEHRPGAYRLTLSLEPVATGLKALRASVHTYFVLDADFDARPGEVLGPDAAESRVSSIGGAVGAVGNRDPQITVLPPVTIAVARPTFSIGQKGSRIAAEGSGASGGAPNKPIGNGKGKGGN